jgi:hypothetical protein
MLRYALQTARTGAAVAEVNQVRRTPDRLHRNNERRRRSGRMTIVIFLNGRRRDIGDRRHQMRLVQCDAAESSLPEMACPPFARVNVSRIDAMHPRERRSQAVSMLGRENEMHVVRRQLPAPHRNARSRAMLLQEIA